MTATPDGGFIVTGFSGVGPAWAFKTDADGDILWRYERPLELERLSLSARPRSGVSLRSRYGGAVAMPDGSAFLCGSAPDPANGVQSAIVTHMGKDGQVLGETRVGEDGHKLSDVYAMGNCFLWGDEIVVVGGYAQKGDAPFFVFALDKMGKLNWKKMFSPLPPNMRAHRPRGEISNLTTNQELMPWASTISVAPAPDGDVVNILTNDRSNSELDAIDHGGRPVVRKSLSGPTLLISSPDPRAQLIVYRPSKSPPSNDVLQVLGERFQMINESRFKTRPLNYALGGYRLPNGSLLLFGGARGNGLIVPSRAAHLTADLQHESHVDLKVPGAMMGGNGIISTASSRSGEYLFVIPFGKNPESRLSSGNLASNKPGIGLFFIKVN